MAPAVTLKKTGVIGLAMLVGISSSGAFLLFAFSRWEALLMTIAPQRRMELRSLDFFVELGFILIGGFIFGVTSTVIAPGAGSLLIGTAAVLAFIFLLPAMFLEGGFLPILFVMPLAGSAGFAALVCLGQGVVHRFWPGVLDRSSSSFKLHS